jgi:RNA polymerase sigma-70 factor (ECF subfamily)
MRPSVAGPVRSVSELPAGRLTAQRAPVLTGRRARAEDDGVSDEALLSGMALGDERACLAFVRRYQHRLFGLAVGIVGDHGVAEDVAQEAFVRIVRHAAMFDARRGSVASWVLTITRNLAIDAVRVRRGVPTPPDDRTFLELTSADRLPEEGATAGDDLARARAALAQLPVEQRRAVVLAAMYGRTAGEIAAAEEVPLGTAKSRIRLGMAKLRELVGTAEAR